MPYRFHPTKRGLYKLAAEKAAELSWLELPKSSEMLFEHGKHSAWLLWPYHKIYFTPSPYPLLAVEQYGDAPSDEAKCVRQRKVFNFSLADLQAYGLVKEVPIKGELLMKYQLAEKSHYLLKHAMYELTYEKLKDDPNWSIEPFTYTFMHEEPTSDKVSLGWVTGMTAHICIQADTAHFIVEQRKQDGSLPQRKEIKVTFDELFNFGLVEIVPDKPHQSFFWHKDK